MSYAYSPELKEPARVPVIDPSKPAMAGMLKILVLTHKRQTAAFTAPEGLTISQHQIAEVPCFVIRPEEKTSENADKTRLPGVLMIHGGAFYLPVQTSALNLACEYAKRLSACVIVPNYRMVPAFTAPAQLNDCLAVWNALTGCGAEIGIDSEKLLVMGDSAGATLAVSLCLTMRDQKGKLPKGQLLIYPVLDNREEPYESYRLYANAAWPESCNRLMWEAYLKDAGEEWIPYLVPMRADSLKGLPMAYVEPQEIDVLRDEGIAFAKALEEAGVETELNVVKGSYHNFDSDLTSPLVKRTIEKRICVAERMLKS